MGDFGQGYAGLLASFPLHLAVPAHLGGRNRRRQFSSRHLRDQYLTDPRYLVRTRSVYVNESTVCGLHHHTELSNS